MLVEQKDYFQILESIKIEIKKAQYKAVLGANKEQIILFWNIGNIIIVILSIKPLPLSQCLLVKTG